MNVGRTIRTVIVDDEIAFINTLKIMLKPFESFDIISTARTVEEAIICIEQLQPDLVFLDIQLEDGTGFDVLRKINTHYHPKIIFVTAYDAYAVKAFRYSAVDYLMKPVIKKDLISAVKKAEHLINQEDLDMKYNVLLENLMKNDSSNKKIVLKEQHTHHVIPINDIIMCHAEGSYTLFHLDSGRTIFVSKHLKEFEDLLPTNIFYRVHRSYLINIDKIEKYERSEGGILVLEDGSQIPVSIRKRQGLTELLSNMT